MVHLRFLFATLVTLEISALLPARAADRATRTLETASLEKSLEKLRKRYDVPGMSGAIAEGGAVIWTKGFGEAEIGKRPADENTIYHLASLTKPFAAVVLLQLVQEGKLNLDARASGFGITFTNSDLITIRHILTHTSEGTPGAAFKYNGARFRLLDNVITNLTGRSFAEELHDRILKPLSLTNTSPNPQQSRACELVHRNAAEFSRRLAQGYASDGKTPINYRDGFSSAAGLVSTAGDVARFSIAWDNDELLRPETKQLASTPPKSSAGKPLPYALGWFVYEHRDETILWHYGWWDGVSSLIIKIPARRLTFVLLANSDMLSRPFNLGGDNNLRRSKFAEEFLDAIKR